VICRLRHSDIGLTYLELILEEKNPNQKFPDSSELSSIRVFLRSNIDQLGLVYMSLLEYRYIP